MSAILPVLELMQGRMKVLAYHGVEADPSGPYAVGRQEFAAQMHFLADQGFEVIGLDALLARLRTRQLNARCLALTFDGGYKSVIDNALPVLERLRYTATIFLPTQLISGWPQTAAAGATSWPNFMDWQDVVQLRRMGLQFGGHTMNHRALLKIPLQQAREEIVGSFCDLRAYIRQEFVPFAYPYGQYNSTIADLVKRAGFSCACGYGDILGNSARTDLFRLRRESIVQATSLNEFSHKVNPNKDAFRKFCSVWRRRASRPKLPPPFTA